jgi:hypothetical protein
MDEVEEERRGGGDVPAPPRPWLNGPLRDEEEERRPFSSVVVMRDAIFACLLALLAVDGESVVRRRLRVELSCVVVTKEEGGGRWKVEG